MFNTLKKYIWANIISANGYFILISSIQVFNFLSAQRITDGLGPALTALLPLSIFWSICIIALWILIFEKIFNFQIKENKIQNHWIYNSIFSIGFIISTIYLIVSIVIVIISLVIIHL